MGLFFNTQTKLAARFELRSAGYGFFEINSMMRRADDAMVTRAVDIARGLGHAIPEALVNPDVSDDEGRGALGDGTLIKLFFEFLKSEQGQALIKILVSLLIGAI